MVLIFNKIPLICTITLTCFLGTAAVGVYAQEGEKLPDPSVKNPGVERSPSVSDGQELPLESQDQPQRRIVDGRPRLYLFKRVINPLTGLGKFMKRTIVLSERRLQTFAEKGRAPERESGFRFYLSGAGSGSGLGSGVRYVNKDLFGTGTQVEMPFLITYKNYQVFEMNATVPLLGDQRLNFDLGSAYRSRTRDNFFGIGNDTLFSDRTRFRSVTRELRSGFSSQMTEHWKAGLHVSYRNIGITEPSGSSFPSAQETLDPALIPGLLRGAELLSGILSLENNTKDNKYIPSSGGLRLVEVSLNEGLGGGDFSFWRYRLDLQQFIPLGNTRRKIIAFRGLFETNQEKGGSQIPFFELASLGGATTLRSFQNFRYYDKTALAFLVEYRYRIWRAFDWIIFLEEGQVAPEPGDLGWNKFHPGYGVRFFIRVTPTIPVSFDFAHGKDGWRVYFRFKPLF